jgi:hypothetical protein
MNIYIFTNKEAAVKSLIAKAQFVPVKDLSKHSAGSDDITYLDVSGLSAADIKKNVAHLKKNCHGSHWGVIDPKGGVADPAALFFEGACDYLGASFLKDIKSVDAKRLKEAHSWQKILAASAGEDAKSGKDAEGGGFLKTGIKLPAESSFPGWKKMQAGKTANFYLLYCSLQGKVPLDDRLDAKTHAAVHQRFLSILEDAFYEGEGLLWMNSGKDCLFLVPPKVKCIEEVIRSAVNMIVSAPLLSIESLEVPVPANFVFALHYGTVNYKPPGKTGTVVSDAINFIFHLGTKKADAGRLTVSNEVPDKTVPAALQDCFVPAGEFEGRSIWHTKKFSYAKPWV